MTKIVLIHGRRQHTKDYENPDTDMERAHILFRKRSWLSGLAAGFAKAGRRPITESDAIFPFYGNVFARSIARYKSENGVPPELEIASAPEGTQSIGARTTYVTLLEQLSSDLGFNPSREMSYGGYEYSPPSSSTTNELGIPGFILESQRVRSILQFLSRKTGIAAEIIEFVLADVAYYLAVEPVRTAVLDHVRKAIRETLGGEKAIVIGHSLGSVVAADLLSETGGSAAFAERQVTLFVTAGSPLGLNVVQEHLKSGVRDGRALVPARVPRDKRTTCWLNAYDVRDVVALVHPLAPRFVPGGLIDDEITVNTTNPHSISDYLSDPDVALPIATQFGAAG